VRLSYADRRWVAATAAGLVGALALGLGGHGSR